MAGCCWNYPIAADLAVDIVAYQTDYKSVESLAAAGDYRTVIVARPARVTPAVELRERRRQFLIADFLVPLTLRVAVSPVGFSQTRDNVRGAFFFGLERFARHKNYKSRYTSRR